MKKSGNYKFLRVILTFAVVTLCCLRITAQDNPVITEVSRSKNQNEKLILEAKLNQNEFRLGESIELSLTIKNYTGSTIDIFDVEPERSFEITVKNIKGKTLPLTQEGINKKYPAIIMARQGAYIERGKELKIRKFSLDKMFDFRDSGDYVLEIGVDYYMEDDSKNNKTSSNQYKKLISIVKFQIR